MRNIPSRKQFLAKVLGLVAATGLAPGLLAGGSVRLATDSRKSKAVIKLRPDSRAVARREETV